MLNKAAFVQALCRYGVIGLLTESLRRIAAAVYHQSHVRWYRFENQIWDVVHGTDTARIEIPPHPHFKVCQASPSGRLRSAVRSLGIDTRQFTFVDIGCGHGKALIVASKVGFRKLIGIDYSQEIVDVAQQNLATTGVQAEVRVCDAREYELPEGPLVVYLANPFDGPILRDALDNFKRTLNRRNGNNAFFIYYYPVEPNEFEQRFKEIRRGYLYRLYSM